MADGFNSFSDDLFVNMDLHTSLDLPRGRETILQFCETVQKQFPDMGDFYQRDGGDFVLEGDRQSGSYRWMEISRRRLGSGAFNPSEVRDACAQHIWVLERSRYFLGISPLDVERLDLIYGFNLDYLGNRDAIVCEALLGGSRLGAMITESDGVALHFEPALVVAMNPECSLECRLAVETRNSSYQVRTGNYESEPISIYLTVCGYPKPTGKFDMESALSIQAEVAEDVVSRVVIPQIIRPIAAAISAAQ